MSDSACASYDHGPGEMQSMRMPRASVMLVATIEHPDGRDTSHRVRDVSAGGIRIDGARELQAGMIVSVRVGAVHATGVSVRWARDGLAGLAFAEPIDPEDTRKKPGTTAVARPATAGGDRPGPAPTAGWIGDLRNAYVR